MFGLQPIHLIIIVVIALLVFGPARMSDIGRSLGATIKEFRAATKDSSPSEEDKS